jgi:DNA-binding NtrC family response regulator
VRELKNVIERALILCDGDILLPEQLNLTVSDGQDFSSLHDIKDMAVKSAERIKIEEALKKTKGNKSKAAEILKVSYKTLLNKIKEYGISDVI